MKDKNSKTEKSTNRQKNNETNLSAANVAADIMSDGNRWFYPESRLVTTHSVQGVSSEQVKHAFERGELPDGTPLTTLPELLDNPQPLKNYVENPDSWAIKSEEDAIPWAVLCREYEESTDDKARQKVVERLIEMHDFAVDPDSDELLRYSGETGIYEENGGEYVRQLLEKNLERFNSERESNKIIYKLKQHPETRRDFTPPGSKICVKNGVIDLSKPEKPEILSHSPDYHFRTRMGVEFDESADSPRFDQFIAKQVADRDINKIQEFIGYIIGSTDRVLFQKALILVGPTAAGKSTFLDSIVKLLGENNTSHLTLQQMSDSRFALSKAHNAYANICNDLDTDAVQNTGRFKQLVSGDTVEANRKHEDHFRFEMTAKQVYATNRVPTIKDADDAVYRRWLHVRFPESVPEEDRDKNLERALEDELPGILNWALEGYARLMRQDGFSAERSTEEKRDLWQGHGNSIDRFISTNVGMSKDNREPKEKLYEAYTDFCHQNELPVETKQKFTKRLKQEHDVVTSRPRIDGERTRCYRGISLIDSTSPFSSTDPGPEDGADSADVPSAFTKTDNCGSQEGDSENKDIPDPFVN